LSYVPTVNDILDDYKLQKEALGQYLKSTSVDGQYSSITIDLVKRTRGELANAFALLCIAATEAAVRLHFNQAAHSKNATTSYSERARLLDAKFEGRAPFEEILDLWKPPTGSAGISADAIGQFKSIYRHRHWLAHGRYWPNRSGRAEVDPDSVILALRDVQSVVPDFPVRV